MSDGAMTAEQLDLRVSRYQTLDRVQDRDDVGLIAGHHSGTHSSPAMLVEVANFSNRHREAPMHLRHDRSDDGPLLL